mgnify:FL=1
MSESLSFGLDRLRPSYRAQQSIPDTAPPQYVCFADLRKSVLALNEFDDYLGRCGEKS